MSEQRYFYPIKKTTLAIRIFRITPMILVTGGTGLVGSHLLYQLTLENEPIKAIYRSEDRLAGVKHVFSYFTEDVDALFSKIQWVKADITNIPSLDVAFKNVDIVYHVAALVSFDPKDYRAMRQINIDGTANVVNFCISNQIKKLCFVSSIAAIGEALNGNETTEENEWSLETGNNGYSITKHGAEMEVWRASQEGVDIVIVNPGVILGGGFWNINTGQLFSKVANGFKFYTTGTTGFVGVNDVVKAMISLVKNDVKNQQFILVSENKSFKEVFTLIANALGKKPPTIKITKVITSVFQRLDYMATLITRKKRLFTKDSAKSLHSQTAYSSEKIKNDIGFEFTPLVDTIEEVASFYKKDY
jgi:nucleoside-diphosphate-sugar epimerase